MDGTTGLGKWDYPTRHGRRRRELHLLVGVAVLFAGGTTTVPKCQSTNLVGNVAITSGGIQASAPEPAFILLTDNASTSCSLTGYPSISAWADHQVGSPATRVSAPTPFITLTPQNTTADRSPDNFSTQNC